MARKKLLRGMGSLTKVPSCTHGLEARCKCGFVGRFYDLTGDERKKTYDDYDTGWDYQFKLFDTKRQNRGRTTKSKGTALPFAEYAEEWLKGMRHLRVNAIKGYRSLLKNHANPAFGKTPINKFTKKMIGDLIDDMYEVRIRPGAKRDEDGKLIPTAVYAGSVDILIKYVLRPIFRQAVTDGWLTANPAEGHKLLEVPDAQRYLPTMEQVHQIAHTIDPFYRLAIYLATGAGLREGEFLGASEDILREDRLYIHRQWRTDGEWGPLKGSKKSKGRNVPLDALLQAEIERHIDLYDVQPGGLFFESEQRPGQPVSSATFDRALREACMKLGFDDLGITSHNFRHAFASYMILSGVELAEVSKMLGHASYDTTYNVYFHLLTPSWSKVQRAANTFLSTGLADLDDVRGANAYAEEEKKTRIAALLAELAELGVGAELAA